MVLSKANESDSKGRPSTSFRSAQRKALDALFNFWLAAIRKVLAERTKKRKPMDKEVWGVLLSGFSKHEIIRPLTDELRYLEVELAKPYSAWTPKERFDGAVFVAEVLNDVRLKFFERSRGRPKKKLPNLGIIANAQREGAAEQKRRDKELIRKLKPNIPAWIDDRKLKTYAREESLGKWTLEQTRRFIRDNPDRRVDVDRAISTAAAVRHYLNTVGLDKKWERALRQHLSRVSKSRKS